MFLHAKHLSEIGHRKVMIKTVDTDVVVIVVSLYQQLGLQELWIEFGNLIRMRWLPIHKYALNLGEKLC